LTIHYVKVSPEKMYLTNSNPETTHHGSSSGELDFVTNSSSEQTGNEVEFNLTPIVASQRAFKVPAESEATSARATFQAQVSPSINLLRIPSSGQESTDICGVYNSPITPLDARFQESGLVKAVEVIEHQPRSKLKDNHAYSELNLCCLE